MRALKSRAPNSTEVGSANSYFLMNWTIGRFDGRSLFFSSHNAVPFPRGSRLDRRDLAGGLLESREGGVGDDLRRATSARRQASVHGQEEGGRQEEGRGAITPLANNPQPLGSRRSTHCVHKNI